MADISDTLPSIPRAAPPTQPRWRLRRLRISISERFLLLLFGDLAILSLALWAVLQFVRPFAGPGDAHIVLRLHWWPLLWVLWLPCAAVVRCYDLKRASRAIQSGVSCAFLVGAVSAIYLVVPVISAPLTRSRLAWLIFALLAMLGVGLWRFAYARLIRQPTFSRRVLVVGASAAAQVLSEAIDAMGEGSGVQLLGFLDDQPALQGCQVANHPVLGALGQLPTLVEQLDVDEIVVALDDVSAISDPLLRMLASCWSHGVTVKPVQTSFEELTAAVMVHFTGQNLYMLMNQRESGLLRLWDAARRLADVVIGLAGLLVLVPFLPLIALAIYLDSPGPIFYRQERVGRGGHTFWLTKFRSMVPDAEPNGAVWASKDDGRITRVGRLLRKSRIDELPQLWNVLVGNMTLIGPRPERPEFVEQLDELLPYYCVRHSLRPGLTGWAQVRHRYGNTVDDALWKLRYDLYYLKHRGPILDAMILLHTIRVVLTMQGT